MFQEPNIKKLKRSITGNQFDIWNLYFDKIEPQGVERQDFNFGMLMQQLCHMFGGKASFDAFLPSFKERWLEENGDSDEAALERGRMLQMKMRHITATINAGLKREQDQNG